MKVLPPEVEEILAKFRLNREQLQEISEKVEQQMKMGLAKTQGSSIAMLPSYVPALPDGTGKNAEKWKFNEKI